MHEYKVFSTGKKDPLGPDESSGTFTSRFLEMLKLIKPSWSQCVKSRFISFVFFYSNPNVNFEFFALIISEIKMNQSQWYWKGKYEQERKMVDR